MSPELSKRHEATDGSRPEACLLPSDQAWLDSFGVDPSWQDSPELCKELSDIIQVGSLRLNESVNQAPEAHTRIMQARLQFMEFVGVPDHALESFRSTSPTIIPIDTFLETQRTMASLRLNSLQVINTCPSILGYAPESVQAKVSNLSDLGLNAVKVINTHPSVLRYAPESVQAKVSNLSDLGLNAVKVLNTYPSVLGLASESVQAKVSNLSDLGLNAVKVINTYPSVLGLASESVQAKVKLLNRSVKLLQWEHTVQELVETMPSILGYSQQKLKIMIRIAAYNINLNSRTVSPNQVGKSLFIPLEKYLVVLAEANANKQYELSDLVWEATKVSLNSRDRKKVALEYAKSGDKLSPRISQMYERYRS